MEPQYVRTAEDIGNIVALEHVNVLIPDQQLATMFYVTGLGLTRDPYIMTSTDNMWINVGRSQFHLPTGEAQVLRGRVGHRAAGPRGPAETSRARARRARGNEIRCARAQFLRRRDQPLGQQHPVSRPRAAFRPDHAGDSLCRVRRRSRYADGIARFYREVLGTSAAVGEDEHGLHARASVGAKQDLIFRETDRPLPPYDGHHIQIYIADFSGPHRRLLERGLVTEESDQHQYRFKDIVDPESGKHLFTIEHEIRSMQHPLYARPLVNRDPAQTNRDYAPGPRCLDLVACRMMLSRHR